MEDTQIIKTLSEIIRINELAKSTIERSSREAVISFLKLYNGSIDVERYDYIFNYFFQECRLIKVSVGTNTDSDGSSFEFINITYKSLTNGEIETKDLCRFNSIDIFDVFDCIKETLEIE